MKKSFRSLLQKHFLLVALLLLSIFINIAFGYWIFSTQIFISPGAKRPYSGDTAAITIELMKNAPILISPSQEATSVSSNELPLETRVGENPLFESDKKPNTSIQNQQTEQLNSLAGLNQASTSVIPTSNSPNSDQSNKPIEPSLLEPPSERTGAGALTRSMRRGSRSGNLPSNTGTYEQKSSSAKKFFDNLRMHGSAVDQEIICLLVNSQVICADGWILSAPLADEWIKWSTIGLAPTEWPVNKTKLEPLSSNP
jgi:hypothetical protein